MITVEVLLALRRWWREGLIAVLVLALWGTWSCRGAALERTEAKLERERVARTAAEQTAASCDAALTVQTGAVELHRQRMVADRAAAREAAAAAAERASRDRAALAERDRREVELRAELEALPPDDRCEAAARWAADRYREVVHAP
jgi:hypothetical protein